jgi:hypothetical protein
MFGRGWWSFRVAMFNLQKITQIRKKLFFLGIRNMGESHAAKSIGEMNLAATLNIIVSVIWVLCHYGKLFR